MRIISKMGNKYNVTYHVFPNPAKTVLSDSHMFQKVYSNTSLSTKIRFLYDCMYIGCVFYRSQLSTVPISHACLVLIHVY